MLHSQPLTPEDRNKHKEKMLLFKLEVLLGESTSIMRRLELAHILLQTIKEFKHQEDVLNQLVYDKYKKHQ